MAGASLGMRLTGAAAFLDALDDLKDTYTADGDGYVVGTNVPYSIHQEFGTYKMAAQPHVRPGIDATRAQMAEFATRADDLDEFLSLTAHHLEGEIKTRAPVDTGHLRASYRTEKL